jgi:hypothetical protein
LVTASEVGKTENNKIFNFIVLAQQSLISLLLYFCLLDINILTGIVAWLKILIIIYIKKH